MAENPCEIVQMSANDWTEVRRIYQEGIATGHATFQLDPPSWQEWDRAHIAACRLVARSTRGVMGWAALSLTSNRAVYAGVAEVSIYIGQSYRGRGVGRRLLNRLIIASEEHGLWTLQAGIFPENQSSLALHRKSGFREVGRRERIGQLHGLWRDVILLERRSLVVGSG